MAICYFLMGLTKTDLSGFTEESSSETIIMFIFFHKLSYISMSISSIAFIGYVSNAKGLFTLFTIGALTLAFVLFFSVYNNIKDKNYKLKKIYLIRTISFLLIQGLFLLIKNNII